MGPKRQVVRGNWPGLGPDVGTYDFLKALLDSMRLSVGIPGHAEATSIRGGFTHGSSVQENHCADARQVPGRRLRRQQIVDRAAA
jgi:hypothetical protein